MNLYIHELVLELALRETMRHYVDARGLTEEIFSRLHERSEGSIHSADVPDMLPELLNDCSTVLHVIRSTIPDQTAASGLLVQAARKVLELHAAGEMHQFKRRVERNFFLGFFSLLQKFAEPTDEAQTLLLDAQRALCSVKCDLDDVIYGEKFFESVRDGVAPR